MVVVLGTGWGPVWNSGPAEPVVVGNSRYMWELGVCGAL